MERMVKVNKLIKLEENIEKLDVIMKELKSPYLLDGDITLYFDTDIFTNIYGYKNIPTSFDTSIIVFSKTINETLIEMKYERDKMVKELYKKWKTKEA